MADEQTIEQPEVQAPEQQDQQAPTPPQPTLPDDKKKELHGIVTKMILGGESEDNIKLVIDHYTKKFAAAPTGPLGTVIPKFAPAMQRPATDIQGAHPVVQNVPLHYTSPFTAPMPQTVEEKHQSDVLAAHQRVVDEMPKTDAAIKNVIKSYKTQAQMAQFQTDLQNKGVDATAHPALLEHVQALLPKAAIQVSDAEVQAYKDQMKDNPAMAREALYEHAKLNPDKAGQIAADTYLLDSQQRAGGTNTDQILKNAEAIKSGQNQYSIWHGGNVIKPEGFLESMARGFGERQKQFGDYDFLGSAKDEDIIKEYENRRNTPANLDAPIPIASGFWGGFGQLTGAESPTMIKGAIPHILATGTGGIAEAIAPWVGSLVVSPDFYQRGYANSFSQNYNTLRNEGKTPQEALQIAKDRAAFDAREDVALGITMTAMGAKVGGAAAAEAKLSPGFMNAVKGAAKTMVQSTPEAAGLGIAGGLGQLQKNINAGKPIEEGVPDAIFNTIGFHYGVGLIAMGGSVIKSPLYKSAVDNMARQPEDLVNKAIGEKVESNEITPQQANDAHLIIQNRKAQFDDLTNKAKEIVAKGKVKGISAEPLQHAALNDHDQFVKYLQNIAEQAHDPKSEETTLDTYGQDLVNIAKQLYPKEEEFAEPEVPRETVSPGNNIEKAKGLLRQGIESGKIEKDYAPFEEHADHLLTYINDQSKGGKEKDMRAEFGDEMVDLAKEHAASQPTEIAPVQTFRTLDYGENKGQPEDQEAQNAIKQQIVNDEPIGNTGEKFSGFLGRIIPGFQDLLAKEDHNTVLVTHSSVIKALKVWEEMGRPEVSELTGDKLKDFAQKYVDLKPEAEGKVHTFTGDDGKEIHVVRHGETEDNKLSEFREDDTQLTDKGRSQAQRAGQQLQTALKGQPAAKIITSDLPRTIETSNIIRSELGTKPQETAKTTEVSDTEKPNEAATALQGSYDRLIASGTDPNDPDMIKLKDKINSLNNKSKENATSVRSDTGQSSGTGDATSGSQNEGQQNLQLPPQQETKPTETVQQAGQGGGPPEVDDLPFTGRTSETVGIAHASAAKRATESPVLPPERGEGVSVEEAVQHGRDLMDKGEDPQKAADDFLKDKKISYDSLSLVRAKHAELAKATNKAADEFGDNSPQAKAAGKEESNWYNNVVKPMQTEWSKIGQTQQGETEIDTGTVTGLRRAYQEQSGKNFTPEQEAKAKELVGQVKALTDKVNKLEKQLSDSHGKEATTPETGNIKAKAKQAADWIRKGKSAPPGSFSAATPLSVLWDGMVEAAAKIVEAGGTIAEAIDAGIKHLKDSEWYKELSKEKQQKAEQDFTSHINESNPNLAERFANKTDNKFSTKDAKDIWEHVKEQYLDKGVELPDAIKNASTDLGLTSEQIVNAISTPKGAKNITDEIFKNQYERRKAINSAKYFVANADKSGFQKAIGKLPTLAFNLKTWGHGTVGNITHAGPNIFRPSTWSAYWPNVLKSFQLAYGKTSSYEKAITFLKNRPNFDNWVRAGLAVDPNKVYDEYQLLGKAQKKTIVGKAFQWMNEAGTRGFSGLNFMRYDMAELLYNRASNAAKSDPNFRTEVAELVNHATGHSEVKVPKAIKVITFAPGLEISRWQRMITDPAKAAKTFATWKGASESEKAAAKIVAQSAGEKIAMWGTLLAANAGMLSAMGSKQKVNLSDPSQSDWMKFKFGGKTLDMSGNLLSPVRLLSGLVHNAYLANVGNKKDLKMKPGDKDASTLTQQARYKLSPIAGTVTDIGTGTDAMGNVLPWSNIKPSAGRHKMTWKELISQESLPIPIAAGLQSYWNSMHERGMSENQIDAIMNGVLTFGIEGFTGAKYQEDYSLERKSKSTGENRK